jgi:hypothetical protein
LQKDFRVLFHEDGMPIDSRCIERFVKAFPKGYRTVVEKIIANSEMLNPQTFEENLKLLLPSFKMTRAGIFHSPRTKDGKSSTGFAKIAELCWSQVGEDLESLKKIVTNATVERSRIVADLPSDSMKHAIAVCSGIFEKLLKVHVQDSYIRPVGATKVLFSAFPEIALPVDNLQWRCLFKTKEYHVVLSTMVEEIRKWEKLNSPTRLGTLSPTPTTLPSIYNILAMAARDLNKANW